MVRRGRRRRRRRQRGGILPFLVPLALAAGKAIAAGAVSGAAGYGVKKGLDAATRKKRVGKISWAQAQANQRLVRNMRNRWMNVQEQRECHVEQRQVASLGLETPLDRQETQSIWTGGQRGQETGQGSAQVETTTRLERVGGEGAAETAWQGLLDAAAAPARRMVGRGLDVQKWLAKTGIEFHWPGYQYMGPGTHLEKRLKRGDPGINRLDRIAKQHDIDYSRARSHQDKWKADDKMIRAIQSLPGKKTWTEAIVQKIMQAKRKLKL